MHRAEGGGPYRPPTPIEQLWRAVESLDERLARVEAARDRARADGARTARVATALACALAATLGALVWLLLGLGGVGR